MHSPHKRGLLPLGLHFVIETLGSVAGFAIGLFATMIVFRMFDLSTKSLAGIAVAALMILGGCILPTYIMNTFISVKCNYCGGRSWVGKPKGRDNLAFECEVCGKEMNDE